MIIVYKLYLLHSIVTSLAWLQLVTGVGGQEFLLPKHLSIEVLSMFVLQIG